MAIAKINGVDVTSGSVIYGLSGFSKVNGIDLSASFDTDAQNYFDQIVVNGGTIGSSAKSAINTFVVGCKADGTWSGLLDVGPVAGDNLAAGLTKLKKLSTGWSYTNHNFVEGDYSQATGLAGNGSNKYLGAGFNTNALTLNSTGLGVYNRSTHDSTENIHGTRATSAADFYVYSPYVDGSVIINAYNDSSGAGGGPVSGAVGFIYGSVTSSSSVKIYRNGASLGTSGSVTGSLPGVEMLYYALNNNGSAVTFSAHTYSFFVVTSGLDDTQAAALNTRVQALQTALGRNV